MAIIRNDKRDMHEDQTSVQGNVFKNDKPSVANPDLHVVVGSLWSDYAGALDGNGEFGKLVIDENGNYTYTLTKDMNYLGDGVDVVDKFTFIEEYYEGGVLKSKRREIRIDIHGKNDQPLISDVSVSAYEGGNFAGDTSVLSSVNPDVNFVGQLTLGDIDPNTPGIQTDVDTGDTHRFHKVVNSVKVDSNNVDKKLLTGVDVTVNPDGTYTVTGDFDALSVGDTATVTFQYEVIDRSIAGSTTPSDPKTVTLTVIGQNDTVSIIDDTITTYDQLIDGDIYKSILENDGHYEGGVKVNDVDVNDKLTIASTGFHDLQFYKEGGSISVDNAARTLQYTPGSGGAIAKDHFSFYYQGTDGHTDPIGSAVAEFAMKNKDDKDIDWYQFGDNGDDTLNGIKGATNVLSGMGGNDYIEGKEKGDILYGGAGDDEMQGGWGNDIYKAGKGTDGMVDSRGADLYVFSKGDGRNTIDDADLEVYTDAMGHPDINLRNYSNVVEVAKLVDPNIEDNMNFLERFADVDTVRFDKSVDKSKIAIFQEDGQYGSLLIKYSENADDKISIGWQKEDHYGIEKIEAADGTYLTKAALDRIATEISTYDIDANTAGIQTAQSVQDVQNNEHLMAFIAGQWA